jgi:hypothetical protein
MMKRSGAKMIAECASDLADKALHWKARARAAEEALMKFAGEIYRCDSGSGSQSEDAPQSAAEAEGPHSGAAKTAHRPNSPCSLDKEESR